ncbi:MAG: hypothetical protein HQL63_15555 [Magnetococcales bacterium]|nr:hypothetical protein [Magnetococcales bacterium]MBF0322619.1 hypothetical protein [Magnetococcales bacterium]
MSQCQNGKLDEKVMATRWMIGLLVAGVWLLLPDTGTAEPFCVVDFAGKRCWYQDVESCRQAAGPRGSCVVNSAGIVAPVGGARYCVVESWQTQCIYNDEGSCRHAAERRRGECITNPNDLPHGPVNQGRRLDREADGGHTGKMLPNVKNDAPDQHGTPTSSPIDPGSEVKPSPAIGHE